MVEPSSIFNDPLEYCVDDSCNIKPEINYMSTRNEQKKLHANLKERTDLILQRFSEVKNIPESHLTQKEVYDYFGWSQGKWQGWRSGTVQKMSAPDALKVSRELGIDHDWLVTGRGDPFPEKSQAKDADESHNQKAGLIQKANKVLESDSVYSSALESNINAFYAALESEEELAKVREEKENHDKRIDTLEKFIKQLPDFKSSNTG